MKIADEIVEAAAIKFCEAEGRDPHQMTYITDGGVTQPYGDAFQWFIEPMRAALESVAERIVADAEREAWRPGSDGPSLNPDEHVWVEFGMRPDIAIGHWSESAALEMDGNGWLGADGCWLSDVRRFRPLPVPPAAETER